MKRIILLLTCCFISLQLWSQTANVILFTENGERFTAILNGIRQNDKSETNVKITRLKAEYYKLKVIFDNQKLGERNFNLAVQLENECAYSIKKNSKGEYVLRFISAVPIVNAPTTISGQREIIYINNPASAPSNSETVTHQNTTTVTTNEGNQNPENVNLNVDVNVGGQGGNVSINMSGMDGANTSSTTTTSQTTTTTTTNTEAID